ncbi:Rad52/Rad22 family DNA repair protein [Embleya sp. NPDC059237]|uniref:Rad52/Rad22 family DNA repair protein n=1 Tax=Embleya sp. NPDC059237 TaxID=3346784 RepID=UPI0036C4858E
MLTDAQIRQLFTPIPRNRVLYKQGQAHLAAWDVRRTLTRIFGFTGWSFEIKSTELVSEVNQGGKWTAIYRATGRLTIRDRHGVEVGHWEDGATGAGKNQPSAAGAHDLAYKSAISVALKRCAANLGDQFGLSLYNDGSLDPVVGLSLAYRDETEPVAQPDDPQVADDTDPDGAPAQAEAENTRQPERVQHPAQDADRLAELVAEAQLAWTTRDALTTLLGAAGRAGLADAMVDSKAGPVPFGAMLAARVRTLDVAAAQLDQANATAEAAEEEPPPDDVPARDPLATLLDAIRVGWNNHVALATCRQTATDQGLLDREVPTRDGSTIPLHRMIDGRLGDLAGTRPQPVQEATPANQVPPPGEWNQREPQRASAGQTRAIATVMNAVGVQSSERARRLAIVSGIVGRPVLTMKDLTVPEAGRVLDALNLVQQMPADGRAAELGRYADAAAATSQAA